jgi:hypothetical protein
MSDSPEDILSRELAKLASLSGSIGHLLSGATGGEKEAGKAASLGTQFALRFLPTERYSEKLTLAVPPERALKYGYSVLAEMGSLQKQAGEEAPYPFLKAVVGSGFMGMNPAVIFFEILEGDTAGCVVIITGAAKEGLIKQHTAQKAVQSVVEALNRLS